MPTLNPKLNPPITELAALCLFHTIAPRKKKRPVLDPSQRNRGPLGDPGLKITQSEQLALCLDDLRPTLEDSTVAQATVIRPRLPILADTDIGFAARSLV